MLQTCKLLLFHHLRIKDSVFTCLSLIPRKIHLFPISQFGIRSKKKSHKVFYLCSFQKNISIGGDDFSIWGESQHLSGLPGPVSRVFGSPRFGHSHLPFVLLRQSSGFLPLSRAVGDLSKDLYTTAHFL